MDRKEMHALVDAAIDAVKGCEGCEEILIEHMAVHTVRMVGEHAARELGERLTAGELTPAETYDRLSATMNPLYTLMGDEVSPKMNARIRKEFIARAGRASN